MAYRNEWMSQTIDELEKAGIRFEIADKRYYVFYCYRKSDGARYTYYAGSGRILGVKGIGLNRLIELCDDERKELVFENVKISSVSNGNRCLRFPYNSLFASESGRESYANAGGIRH